MHNNIKGEISIHSAIYLEVKREENQEFEQLNEKGFWRYARTSKGTNKAIKELLYIASKESRFVDYKVIVKDKYWMYGDPMFTIDSKGKAVVGKSR